MLRPYLPFDLLTAYETRSFCRGSAVRSLLEGCRAPTDGNRDHKDTSENNMSVDISDKIK